MLAHNVYFTLNDSSDEAVDRLVRAAHAKLKEHPGVIFFAAGRLAADLQRDVNDRAFHVALHVVFRDRASHDRYQAAAEHLSFIEENKSNWKRVRVFDSYAQS